jgi:hypothetical protein
VSGQCWDTKILSGVTSWFSWPGKPTRPTRVIFPLKKHTRAVFLLYHCEPLDSLLQCPTEGGIRFVRRLYCSSLMQQFVLSVWLQAPQDTTRNCCLKSWRVGKSLVSDSWHEIKYDENWPFCMLYARLVSAMVLDHWSSSGFMSVLEMSLFGLCSQGLLVFFTAPRPPVQKNGKIWYSLP